MSGPLGPKFQHLMSRTRISRHLGLIRRTERSTRIATAAVGAALVVSVGILALFRLGGAVVSLGYDLPFAFHRAGVPSDVRLVLLDELDGAVLDRRDQAKILRKLKEAGASAVIYDIIFDRPSADPAVDLDFAAAMREFREVPADAVSGARGKRLVFLACERKTLDQAGVIGEQLIPPTDVLLDAADDFGLVALPHDERFCVRELSTGSRDEASVTWKAAVALGATLNEKDRLLPRWINFAGPPHTIPSCSGDDVLRGVEPGFLRGKVVIVGGKPELLGAAAGTDLFSTPFHRLYVRSLPLMGGAEMQGNILASLLRGDSLTRPSQQLELALVVVFGAAAGACLAWVQPLRAVMLVVAGFFALVLIGVLSVHLYGVWFAWTVPAFVQLPVALGWGAGANFYIERYFRIRLSEEQRRLREVFARYLSKQMLDRLTEESFSVTLGGKRTTAAMMFTDLEGFTDMCQKVRNPERIVEMLNDYFRRTTKHIFDNDGVIIKFIGDSIFACWGVPIEDTESPMKAVNAAWCLYESARLVVDGDELRTRVGVHFSDDVVAGNIGSDQHIDYTLIGDAVNLTSRLEGLNKMFGTSILVTDAVQQRLGAKWRTRRLGRVCVKGRQDVTIVFELLGPARQEGEPEWITRYHEALAALERGDFAEARRLFSAGDSARKGGDSAARFFIERIDAGEEFLRGAIELKEK